MVLGYLIALVIFGGVDRLGNPNSWQFAVLVVLAFLSLRSND